jgi:hypothetical protein
VDFYYDVGVALHTFFERVVVLFCWFKIPAKASRMNRMNQSKNDGTHSQIRDSWSKVEGKTMALHPSIISSKSYGQSIEKDLPSHHTSHHHTP